MLLKCFSFFKTTLIYKLLDASGSLCKKTLLMQFALMFSTRHLRNYTQIWEKHQRALSAKKNKNKSAILFFILNLNHPHLYTWHISQIRYTLEPNVYRITGTNINWYLMQKKIQIDYQDFNI